MAFGGGGPTSVGPPGSQINTYDLVRICSSWVLWLSVHLSFALVVRSARLDLAVTNAAALVSWSEIEIMRRASLFYCRLFGSLFNQPEHWLSEEFAF